EANVKANGTQRSGGDCSSHHPHDDRSRLERSRGMESGGPRWRYGGISLALVFKLMERRSRDRYAQPDGSEEPERLSGPIHHVRYDAGHVRWRPGRLYRSERLGCTMEGRVSEEIWRV